MDGSFYARVNLSDFDVCRLRSCVRPFDAVDITAGLDEVRTLGPNQISELVSPDSGPVRQNELETGRAVS